MTQFIEVPPQRVPGDSLQGLLEEYASRDGTDYGAREFTLQEKVSQLRAQLEGGELCIIYEIDSQQWDLVSKEQAASILEL